tara:strand:+ start:60 stop:1616 length:1557 start_codon:yes stop_codon:yes gene_type:complete
MHTPNSELSKGSTTEFCSEALGQICLAWAIKNGSRQLTISDLVNAPLSRQTRVSGKWDHFSDNGGLNMNLIRTVSGLCVWADRGSTWSRWSQIFADYISRPLTPSRQESNNNPNWVAAQYRYMSEIVNKYNLNTNYKIINDKVLQRMVRIDGVNPYTAVMQTGISATSRDKWNPADIWCVNKDGFRAMRRLNQQISRRDGKTSVEACNQFIANQFNEGNIIPLSLKKPRGVVSPHLDEMNTGEYIQSISLGRDAGGRNELIEFDSNPTRGQANQDMKINFTIETIQLPEGKRGLKEAARARRGERIAGARPVPGSQRHVRIKYHVNNKKLELEYTQTGEPTVHAAAKMGNIGGDNFRRIIEGTSRSGITRLNQIQSNYSDIDIETSPWFNSSQLDVGSLSSANRRRNEEKVEPHRLRMMEYLDEIWNEINGSNMTQQDQSRFLTTMSIWNKSRAGEVGVAVGGANRDAVKKRIVQNLYELASSIADVVGLSRQDMGSDWIGISNRRTNFNSSAYVKVF